MFVDLTAPLGALGLLEGHTLPADTRVAFERTAAVGGRGAPTFRVSGADRATTMTAVRTSPSVTDGTHVIDTDHETVYRFTWSEELPGLLNCVREAPGTVLTAVATEGAWTFDCRFPGPDAASRFYAAYNDPAHPITIRRMHPAAQAQQGSGDALSPAQREAIEQALEAGYFEVPRQTTLGDLATELGISDSAVSQRLRRGLTTLLRTRVSERHVVGHAEHGDD